MHFSRNLLRMQQTSISNLNKGNKNSYFFSEKLNITKFLNMYHIRYSCLDLGGLKNLLLRSFSCRKVFKFSTLQHFLYTSRISCRSSHMMASIREQSRKRKNNLHTDSKWLLPTLARDIYGRLSPQCSQRCTQVC